MPGFQWQEMIEAIMGSEIHQFATLQLLAAAPFRHRILCGGWYSVYQ